jgi:hypothetical protein
LDYFGRLYLNCKIPLFFFAFDAGFLLLEEDFSGAVEAKFLKMNSFKETNLFDSKTGSVKIYL